jgi:hypothetical protein
VVFATVVCAEEKLAPGWERGANVRLSAAAVATIIGAELVGGARNLGVFAYSGGHRTLLKQIAHGLNFLYCN